MVFEKIYWEEKFSIDNNGIDKDHKKLLDIYNGIIELVSINNYSPEKYARDLSEMIDLALSHFKREENYMKEFSYPDLKKHKLSHMKCIYEISMFNLTFFKSGQPEPDKVLRFLHDWWTNHIQNDDRKYETYRKKFHPNVLYKK